MPHVSEPNPAALPNMITKRDGRSVPFEADKLSQSLFAATADLGQPNAFLASELTDGILHFLAQELAVAAGVSTTQIAELTAKVVRELGQPALAQAYTERQRLNHQNKVARTERENLPFRRSNFASPPKTQPTMLSANASTR